MNTIKKSLLFACITMLFVTCTNNPADKVRKISKFPIDKTITGEHIPFDNPPLCADYVTIVDTFIIIKDMQFCSSYIFHVYNKNTYKFINSFGTKGNGPNEFLKPKPTGQFEINKSFAGMWIYDFHKLKYKFINLSRTIAEQRTIIEKEFTAPKATDVGLDVFILKNNDLIGTSMSPEGRLFYFDSRENTTRWIDYFPEVPYPPVKEKQMHNLYVSATKISPDEKYIVSALRLFKRIDVFNDKLECLFSLTFNDSPGEPDFYRNKNNPVPGGLVHYYTDLYLSEKYIYALNSQITQEQLSKDTDTGYSEVQVFKYDGTPVASYKLDHFIGSFTIDEDNGYILGVTMPTDDLSSPFFRYKML